MPWMMAGAVAAPIVGGLIGNAVAGGDQDAATAAMQQAASIIGSVQIPDPSTLQIVLQHLQSQGQLTPELESALTQQASQLNNWTPQQNQEAAQNSALSSLQQVGQGGLNATDRAAMQQIQGQTAQQVQGQQQAVLQNMAARGMGGSGTELAADLQAGQSGAQMANQQGNNLASQAQQRALQAIQGAGTLGGQMEQSGFGRAQAQSAAQNAINQFNTQNSQAVQNQNVAMQNAAQQANLANKQNIANQNVGLANQQTQYNAQVPLQVYNMNMQKAQAQAGALQGLGGYYNNQAQQQRNMFGGIGAGVGQGLGTAAAFQSLGGGQSPGQFQSGAVQGGGWSVPGGYSATDYGSQSNTPNADGSSNVNFNYADGGTVPEVPHNALQECGGGMAYSQGGNVQVPHNLLQQWMGGTSAGGTMYEKDDSGFASAKEGGSVPGKAKVPGNSPKNDTVKALLSPGEYVMNREEVSKAKKTKDPAKFMAEILHHMASSGKVRRE